MKSIWSISVFLSIVIFTIGFTFTNIDPVFADPGDLWCMLGPSICNSDWENRFEITVDNAQVSGSSDLSNFPMLVHISGTDFTDNLDDAADTLEDIRFTNQAGTVLLDYEIEKFSKADDELVAWVEIPTLDYNDDTIIYMYYDNAGSPPDQQNAEGTWDDNFIGVWHMDSTNPVDSANSNDGTGSGVAVDTSGMVGDAITFDGTNDYITVPHNLTPALVNDDALTIEMWRKSAESNSVEISAWKSNDNFGAWIDGRWYMGNIASWQFLGMGKLTDDAWHYYVLEKGSGNSIAESFRDGSTTAIDSTGSFTATFRDSRSNTMSFGGDQRQSPPTYNFDGELDEIRISNIARGDGWRATTYNNINNPVDVVVEGVGTSSTSNAFMALAVENNAGAPIGGIVGSMDSASLLIAGSQATIDYWWDSLTSLWNDKS